MFLRKQKLPLTEVIHKDVFSSEPFQKKNAKEFFKACQNGSNGEI